MQADSSNEDAKQEGELQAGVGCISQKDPWESHSITQIALQCKQNLTQVKWIKQKMTELNEDDRVGMFSIKI